jgi:hypothetical protein
MFRKMTSGCVREIDGEGWRAQLNLTSQVLALSMAEETSWFRQEEALTASPKADSFVSASMLSIYGKLFDDGLYAAVRLPCSQ